MLALGSQRGEREGRLEGSTHRALVEDLTATAALHVVQGHILAQTCVETKGERQTLPHAFALLEATRCRLDIQQILRAIVVGQGHATHQSAISKQKLAAC